MTKRRTDGEIFGTDVLTFSVIAGATLLLLGAITTPASVTPFEAQAKAPLIETVTVTASPVKGLT